MAIHIQRKRFADLAIANATQAGFHEPANAANFINIVTEVIEDEEGVWLVIAQQGDEVTGDEPLLPEYERVAYPPSVNR